MIGQSLSTTTVFSLKNFGIRNLCNNAAVNYISLRACPFLCSSISCTATSAFSRTYNKCISRCFQPYICNCDIIEFLIGRQEGVSVVYATGMWRRCKTTRTHGPLYSSSIRPSQQDSLLYTQFSRTRPSFISSSIHSIYCGTHLSLYLTISMCDLVLKDLLRRI
jgi:hypothetical protein